MDFRAMKENNELREFLYSKYIEEELSLLEISSLFGFKSSTNVYRALKEYNIRTRSIKEASGQKSRQEKIKATCMQKYGSSNVLSKGTEVYEKRNNTVVEKYGVNNVFQSDGIKRKIKTTNLKKYGVEYPSQSIEIKEKASYNRHKTSIDKWSDMVDTQMVLLKFYNASAVIELKCGKCGHVDYYNKQLIKSRLDNNEDICYVCNPFKSCSREERELKDYINSIYTGPIKYNFKIKNKEADIFLPELGLAFEYNGLYWHSDKNKPKNYHKDKKELFESNGINLIHVYSDDWNFKNDIIKSRVNNIVNGSKKVYARNLKIEEVGSKECKAFLEENHLFGNAYSSTRIALKQEDEIISVITFGRPRRNLGNIKTNEFEYELVRFCNKLGVSVVGGAHRLLKHFIRNNDVIKIYSYADRDWVCRQNNLYLNLGFKEIGITKPNYFYIIKNSKVNRYKFRKDVLISEGFNANKSEREIMEERGINRIYNSGSIKYEFKIING